VQERLQKIIAAAGLASRRQAETLITSGKVTVNGSLIKELGTKANPAEDVKHEASGSSDFEHYKSTTLNEEHHITMPDHVATVEAH